MLKKVKIAHRDLFSIQDFSQQTVNILLQTDQIYTYKNNHNSLLLPLPPHSPPSLKLTVSEQGACHLLGLSGAVRGSEVFLAPEEDSSLEGTNQLYEVT